MQLETMKGSKPLSTVLETLSIITHTHTKAELRVSDIDAQLCDTH